MERERVAAIVMAAGKGTRFRSDLAKVLHTAAGRTLLGHVLAALEPLELGQVVVVVGHQADDVAADAGTASIERLSTVVQEPQNGTAHAVEVALPMLTDGIDKVMVINGDAPLLTPATLRRLADTPAGRAAILTTRLADPTGYGRVLRGADGVVTAIVEDADASDDERAVDEINGGMYVFDRAGLADRLAAVDAANEQGERYVTDVIGMLVADGVPVDGVEAPAAEIAGVNDRAQLAEAAALLRRRHLGTLMADGVTVIDPGATYIDVTVSVGRDTIVQPGCLLEGQTVIGERALIGPYSQLEDTIVEDGAIVRQSVCLGASIGADATVGPFSHLRPGTRLERGAKAGGFVEIKKSVVGEGSKVPHLTYVGDTTIGADVNIGAGTVTVNYDGQDKHETHIGDGAFIGSGSMLMAPLTIGDGAFVAGGSAITDDVPADALAIGRARQVVKEGWAEKRRGSAS